MIKDFGLGNDKPGVYLKEEVHKLVKEIKIHILKDPGTVQDLNFDGFVHFLLQYAYLMWPNQGNAVTLIEKLFDHISSKPKFQ
jgi:hypothetical protein